MGMLAGYFTKESGQNSKENIMLPKGLPVQMGQYFVTYRGDSIGTADKAKTFFIIDYEKKDKLEDAAKEHFTLYPDAYLSIRGQDGITPGQHVVPISLGKLFHRLFFAIEDLDDAHPGYVFLKEGIDARNGRTDAPVGIAYKFAKNKCDDKNAGKNRQCRERKLYVDGE